MKTPNSMSNNSNVIAVIPARWGSSRFPGKPVAEIAGVPMIVRVYRRVCEGPSISRAIVATDDVRIADVLRAHGIDDVVMTPPVCPNGTVRCRAALESLGLRPDVIVNVQGDEPMVSTDTLAALVDAMLSPSQPAIATTAHPFAGSYAELSNPSRVKVVTDEAGMALLFSRAVIPFQRDAAPEQWPSRYRYLIHQGLYAFRFDTFMSLPVEMSPLARLESLEQLSWLDAGIDIRVVETQQSPYPSVDNPEDVRKIEELLARE